MSKRTVGFLAALSFILLVGSGCKKKVPVAALPPPPAPVVKEAPPAPPPPKAPAISQFIAEPSAVERGQGTTLRWMTSDATEASITPGVGAVAINGSRQTSPASTTTYTLYAKGPGGTTSATATVTVTVPPLPQPPSAPPPRKSLSERLISEVQDAYFDFDKSDIRDDARGALSKNSETLKAILHDFPSFTVVIEGHCDERGSAEYNLALGDRRADAARNFLAQLGVPANRIELISYGKERPKCTEANDDCWQKNRRVHFTAGRGAS